MHRMTRRAVVITGLALLACTGPMGEPEPYVTHLTAPWTEMSLPVQGGRVVFSDEDLVTVHHPDLSVETLTGSYGAALESAGFKRGLDTSAEDMTSITFDSEGATLALGIVAGADRTTVSITRYAK